MKNYEQLKKVIQQANPEIMELGKHPEDMFFTVELFK